MTGAILARWIVYEKGTLRKNFGEKLGGMGREDIRGFWGEKQR